MTQQALNIYEAAAQSAIQKPSDSEKYAALNNICSNLAKDFNEWFVIADLLNTEMRVNDLYSLRINEYMSEYAGFCFCSRLQRGDDFCTTKGAKDPTRRDFHCWLCNRLQFHGLADVTFAKFVVFLYALQNEIQSIGDIVSLTETPTDTTPKPFEFPEDLNNDKGLEMLDKAVKAGYITPNDDGSYRWTKTKLLLAYFAAKASEHLGLQPTNGNYKFAPFERLFQEKNFAGRFAKNDTPNGCFDVDKFFRSLE